MLSSTKSQTASSSGSKSQPKLRSACNQCCAAKVKCSGTRTGCERCLSIGTECVYLESRVGRVPGIRAKKRRILGETGGASPQALRLVTTPSNTDTTTTENERETELPSSIPELNEQTWHWAVASPHESESNSEFLDASTSTSSVLVSSENMTAVSGADFINNLTFDMDEIWNSPSTQPLSPVIMPPPAPRVGRIVGAQENLSRQAQREKDEADSQCVVQCCHLISDLESYIIADMEAFQILLGIVRKANERLNELIDTQQSSRNTRCVMLFSTVCYQLVALLQLCHKTMSAPSTSRRTSLLMPGGGLGFGGFGYNEEEESSWKAQRALKEIQQGCETVKRIKLLVGVEAENITAASIIGAVTRENCFTDIEQRFNELAGVIRSKA